MATKLKTKTPAKKSTKTEKTKALDNKAPDLPNETGAIPTMSHIIGEIFWLMLQSPAHQHLSIRDAEWFFMPALANRQARLFHADGKPIGLAMWALVSEEVEKEKLVQQKGKLRPDEWKSGDRAWLVELIAPSATAENKIAEAMVSELMKGPLKGKKLSIRKTNVKTRESEVVELKG